jgi:hypothetical protein
MRPERILLVAGILLATGCYSYVPTRLETVQPGEAVRIRMSPEAAERLEPVRLTDLRIMDGILVAQNPSELFVDTSVGQLDRERGGRAFTQRVNVALGEVIEVELRQRDNLKTGALLGGLGVVAGVAIAASLQDGGGLARPDPGGDTEDRRTPFVLRFRLPF